VRPSLTPAFPAALAPMPVATWAEAVTVRRSTRTYDGSPVTPEWLDHLERFCEGLPAPEVARVAVVRAVPADVFTGIIGGYGRITGALSALLVIGAEAAFAVQEAAGYLGEAAILEATALGLGTCWVAGFFDRERASGLVDLARGERVLAVSPLGNAPTRPPGRDRLFKRALRAHRRKPLEEIAPGLDLATWPAWAMNGLRLAQLSPSAVNRQPWRFRFDAEVSREHTRAAGGTQPADLVSAGTVTVSAVQTGYEGKISRRLDCGIAMLHFEVGARAMGVSGEWEILEAPEVARYRVTAGGAGLLLTRMKNDPTTPARPKAARTR